LETSLGAAGNPYQAAAEKLAQLEERKVTPGGNLAVAHPWPNENQFKYFTLPVARDAEWYRGFINDEHSKGIKVLPYCMFGWFPLEMPECAFYWREWFNPNGSPTELSGWAKYAAARYVPSYIDFLAWRLRELAKEYGFDGVYVDYAGCTEAGQSPPNTD